MPSPGIPSTLLAAIQASLSVLLVVSYGVLAARFKILDQSNAKAISKLCVKVFLPALLLTKIGSELRTDSVSRYGIILLWALICHSISFCIASGARIVAGAPGWVTVAVMFNNTTSYPLLLMQSLEETGILKNLLVLDETTGQAIERAKSYFLVFATVSTCLTFALGPRLMTAGEERTHELEGKRKMDVEERGSIDHRGTSPGPSERTALLSSSPSSSPSRTELGHSSSVPSFVYKILGAFYEFLNAPLIGALLGALVGLTPPLRHVFFAPTSDGGIFSAWVTESIISIGRIFVPLPLLIAGVSLYYSRSNLGHHQVSTPWIATGLVLIVRFVVWPVISIGVVYTLAKNTSLLGDDPMLWFALMLMPTGPSAMKLIAMVQVSGAGPGGEGRIARLLTVSYIVSPILAFTVVAALKASEAAIPL